MPADTLTAGPLLGPLQDNGGFSWTHMLGAGSPAIDAGNNALGATYNQRGTGFARTVDAATDIGSVEHQAAAVPAHVAVPANSTWALGLLGLLLGLFGQRRRREPAPRGDG